MSNTRAALYYPTYAAYRQIATSFTERELLDAVRDSRRALHFTHRDSRGRAKSLLCEALGDALRAYEDELLSRDYDRQFEDNHETSNDDPFFESDVRDYEPGDMIDFGC